MYVNTFMSIILYLILSFKSFVANNKPIRSLVIKIASFTYKVKTFFFLVESLCRYCNNPLFLNPHDFK
jgi:hypothetical protein